MEKSRIVEISDLIKSDFNKSIDETNELSFRDQCELILYVLDEKYDYRPDEEEDLRINEDVIKFCRTFRKVNKFILDKNREGKTTIEEMFPQ